MNNRINGQKTGKTCVCGPKPFESPQKRGTFRVYKNKFFKIKQTADKNILVYFTSCCSSVVEHLLGKEEVGGSIPLNSSKRIKIEKIKLIINNNNKKK